MIALPLLKHEHLHNLLKRLSKVKIKTYIVV